MQKIKKKLAKYLKPSKVITRLSAIQNESLTPIKYKE